MSFSPTVPFLAPGSRTLAPEVPFESPCVAWTSLFDPPAWPTLAATAASNEMIDMLRIAVFLAWGSMGWPPEKSAGVKIDKRLAGAVPSVHINRGAIVGQGVDGAEQ